jgi:hypothetical protein
MGYAFGVYTWGTFVIYQIKFEFFLAALTVEIEVGVSTIGFDSHISCTILSGDPRNRSYGIIQLCLRGFLCLESKWYVYLR